jgi:molecular chaperone DnaJ
MSGQRDQPNQPDLDLGVDHYTLLGVARAADESELRQAFRALAMQHHPDRAGPDSTQVFQRISEAYATLSDPRARARYDAHHVPPGRRGNGGVRPVERGNDNGNGAYDGAGDGAGEGDARVAYDSGEYEGAGGRIGWRRRRPAGSTGYFIARLSGALDKLLAEGAARRLPSGVIELGVLPAEAAAGGRVSLDEVVRTRCPTCGGSARMDLLWCRSCEFAGTVLEPVTFTLEVPPDFRDGLTFSFATDPSDTSPPLRIRLRRL